VSLPFTPEEARLAAAPVLEMPGTDGVEVTFGGSNTGMTRYASSHIIQNTVRKDLRAYVRVVVGNRTASATTNQLSAEAMQEAAKRAREGALATPPDETFPGLTTPEETGHPERAGRFDEATAAASPEQRAAAITHLLSATEGIGAAGVFETSAHAFALFSSTGVDRFDAYTRCAVTCLADSGDATGWAEMSSSNIAEVDTRAVAARATSKAKSGPPKDAPAGTYPVVLEPAAMAILLDYLGYVGFGAKQVIDGESFLASAAGRQVAGMATIADDAWHPLSIGIGFDFEGVRRQRVAVLDSGTATRPVTDRRTAAMLETESTGHSSGSDEVGPAASNLVMEPGDSSFEALVAGVDDGILVTRFHYVNVLDRPETLLTGMTRDGTFRIRDGEVAEPVNNFRFAQNVLEALAATSAIGSELHPFVPDWGSFGSTVAPAVRVDAFSFPSITSH
jgi:PmbA protein